MADRRSWPRAALILSAIVVTAGIAAFWGIRVARGGVNHFPNVVLTTQDGKRVHFYDDLIKGKIVAINFIYSHCEFSCPLETARLAQVQQLLGERVGQDIFFYSISIDPSHDTPAVLKEYARKFHAGPGWTFLTGKQDDIDLLANRLGLSEDASITAAPGEDLDGHTPHLLIGNEATGQWLRDAGTDNPRFLARLIADFVGSRGTVTLPGHGGTGQAFDINSPGQYLFAKECAACHTVGHGDKIGPDLAGVTARRDSEWLSRYITEPDKVLASGDPIARQLQARYGVMMPNLRVGDRDLAALLEFLSSKGSQGAAPVATRESVGDTGDFVLTVDPGTAVVTAGAQTRFAVTFRSVGGFAGWIRPQARGVEGARGAVGSWSIPSVKVSPEMVGKATFTILTLLDTPVGDYPLVFQGVNGASTHQAAAVKLRVTGPPDNVITAAFQPGDPIVGATSFAISGRATAGGWVKDISTFPDGSVHFLSAKANGSGSYTDGPFVLKQLGIYHDVLIDTATGGRTSVVYRGLGDFAARIDGPRRVVRSGKTAEFLVTFSSLSGFAGLVTPTVERMDQPESGSSKWSSESVYVRPGSPGSARLMITAPIVRALTTQIIRVKGTNGAVAHVAPDIALTIEP